MLAPPSVTAVRGSQVWAGQLPAPSGGLRLSRASSPDNFEPDPDVEALHQAVEEADADVSEPASAADTPAVSPRKHLSPVMRFVRTLSPRKSRQNAELRQQGPEEGAGANEQGPHESAEAADAVAPSAIAAGPAAPLDQATQGAVAGVAAKRKLFSWGRSKGSFQAQQLVSYEETSAAAAAVAEQEQQQEVPADAGKSATAATAEPEQPVPDATEGRGTAPSRFTAGRLPSFNPRGMLRSMSRSRAGTEEDKPAQQQQGPGNSAGQRPQQQQLKAAPQGSPPAASSTSYEECTAQMPAGSAAAGVEPWQHQESRIPLPPQPENASGPDAIPWGRVLKETPAAGERQPSPDIDSILEATPEDYDRLQLSGQRRTSSSVGRPSFSRSPMAQPQLAAQELEQPASTEVSSQQGRIAAKSAGKNPAKRSGWAFFGRQAAPAVQQPAATASAQPAEQSEAQHVAEAAQDLQRASTPAGQRGTGSDSAEPSSPADMGAPQGSRLGRLFSGRGARNPEAAKQQAHAAIGAGNAAAFEAVMEQTHSEHRVLPVEAAHDEPDGAAVAARDAVPGDPAGQTEAAGLQRASKGSGMPGFGRMLSRLGSRKRQASSSPAPREQSPAADAAPQAPAAAPRQLQKKRSKLSLMGRQEPTTAVDAGILQMPSPSQRSAAMQRVPTGLVHLERAAAERAGALQSDAALPQDVSSTSRGLLRRLSRPGKTRRFCGTTSVPVSVQNLFQDSLSGTCLWMCYLFPS